MKKQAKAEVIRARCDAGLKQSIEQIAMIRQLDTADIVRQALSAYVQKFKTTPMDFLSA